MKAQMVNAPVSDQPPLEKADVSNVKKLERKTDVLSEEVENCVPT